MKFSINNIFTTFWLCGMILCGGITSYNAFEKKLFTGDLVFVGKLFVGFLVLITIGFFSYCIYKFRIIIVSSNKILSIYPFRFKKETFEISKINNVKLENFIAFRGTVFRRIKISGQKVKLEITDLEFENFERLISELKVDEIKKKKLDLEQAKSNISEINFNIYLLLGLIILLFFTAFKNEINSINIGILICCGILLYASLKRKIKYKRTIKTAYNNCFA